MQKFPCKWLAASAMAVGVLGVAHAGMPDHALQQGSYANQILQKDALTGVTAKVRTLGCSNPQRYQPYVMQKPSGQAGLRTWQEQWVVDGCGKQYPVLLNLREEGARGASWTIAN